jgi:RimJ/RimL family protein N-acetyltransferase
MKDLQDIISNRILLRPICSKDVSLIVQWKSDPLVRAMALNHSSQIDFQEQRNDIEQAITAEDQFYYIICLKKDMGPIGYIRVNLTDDEGKIAWLRFALGTCREQGYMKESLIAFLTNLFNRGIVRIDAEVYQSNTRSQRLVESVGFCVEGQKREAHFNGQNYEDIIVYGLLKKEWMPCQIPNC